MAVYNIGRVAYVNQGAYNPLTTYYKYDVVLYLNGSYVYMYTTPAAGNLPTDATYWDVMLDPSAMNTAVGLISYMHMKYSEDNPLADGDMSDNPGDWLGIYIGSSTTAPTSYSNYVWHNISGVHIGASAPSGSEKIWIDTTVETEVIIQQTGSGVPSANAMYLGQVYVDTVNETAYISVKVGTGATDWKLITNV